MRLIELEPIFYGWPYREGRSVTTETMLSKMIFSNIHPHVDTIEEAHGILFLCPQCYQTNGGAVGTHRVICWGPDVSQDFEPKPGRWKLIGTGMDDLTLIGAHGGSNSVLQLSGCKADFFVEQGNIRIC